jgi:RNA polymerase sigma-70 factor (ECF subfamily)
MLERLQVDPCTWDRADVTPQNRWLDGLDADLKAALDSLPRDQRQAVELRVLGELPYPKIAGVLGCTPLAVRIRVSRGLATLRARLEASQ